MDLSIVLMTYAMQREASRTLLSLLPPQQRGTEGLVYEIIVIDNGSPLPLRLGEVPGHSVPIRVVRVNDALPSPVQALNHAVCELAHSENVMVCIDGARMCSPYMVARSVAQLRQRPDPPCQQD